MKGSSEFSNFFEFFSTSEGLYGRWKRDSASKKTDRLTFQYRDQLRSYLGRDDRLHADDGEYLEPGLSAGSVAKLRRFAMAVQMTQTAIPYLFFRGGTSRGSRDSDRGVPQGLIPGKSHTPGHGGAKRLKVFCHKRFGHFRPG